MQRWLLTACLPLLLLAAVMVVTWLTSKSAVVSIRHTRHLNLLPLNQENIRLKQKAHIARAFVLKNGFNKRICFLIDMKQKSGKKRFFVYDLDGDSILESGLVAHGSGPNGFSASPVFSNQPGSYCTALGKYRIAGSYIGRFGPSFSLQGLDATNNKAMSRHIVLHAYSCVPDAEQDSPICNSLGCPMVSTTFLKKLEPMINSSRLPLLLWVFS